MRSAGTTPWSTSHFRPNIPTASSDEQRKLNTRAQAVASNARRGSGSHAAQTASIMTAFEPVLLGRGPDVVIVVGDVNSTIACALVASKLGVPESDHQMSAAVLARTVMSVKLITAPTIANAPIVTPAATDSDEPTLFLPSAFVPDYRAMQLRLWVNGESQQDGPFARVYTGIFRQLRYSPAGDGSPSLEAARILRTRNVDEKGLGLPLPAGRVAVFERAREESLLVGESDLADRAVGEEVEFATGQSSDLRYRIVARPPSKTRQPFVVEVTNARSTPETFELPIPYTLDSVGAELIEHKGVRTWRTIVPANGSARLEFALKLPR